MKALLVALLVALPSTASAFDLCGSGARINCVVDGDTVWLDGEKIRLEDIDTPEANGKCVEERRVAADAASALAAFLDQGKPEIARNGKDKYGRTLAKIMINGQSAGDALLAKGLAKAWEGHKAEWCGEPG